MGDESPKAQGTTPRGSRERERKAFEFRKAGASYASIGQQLGISESSARRCVHTAMEHVRKIEGEQIRFIKDLELERLDSLTLGVYPLAKKGEANAVDAMLKIMVRRSKYLGLDAPRPEKIEVQFAHNLIKALVPIIHRYMHRLNASNDLFLEMAEELGKAADAVDEYS